MAVERQQNWQPQQRADIPHLRSIESAVAGDFDVLVGQMVSGLNPFVVSGFDTVPPTPGTPATSVQVNVVNGRICHPMASESGTIFSVPAGRTVETLGISNTRVLGSFTASTTNYIGLDLLRSADDSTTDLLQILDSDTLLETPKEAPLARTLDYVLVISNQDFATTPNVAPLVKVVTDANNNVVSVEDARNLMFRLGKGGGVTQPLYTYPWAGGRAEASGNTSFNVGDKVIGSFKDWMDAAMTRIWEVGGGEHWFSPTGWHNVQMVKNGSTLFTSTGDYFEWTGTNLHWRELRFVFSNSTGWFNDVADQLTDAAGAYGTTATNLADGDCLYVDLDRTTNRTGGTALAAIKGVTATLGSPTTPGSRAIIAWRIGSLIFTRGTNYAIGQAFQVATTGALGVVKLHQAATTPLSPIVLSDGDLNTATGVPQFDSNRVLTIGVPTGGGNQTALLATGLGSGTGIQGAGGTTNGVGVLGIGGGNTGIGITGLGAAHVGVGSGIGGSFTGGTNTGTSSETGTSGAGVFTTGPNTGFGPALVTKQAATANIAAQNRAQRSDNYPGATTDYLGFRSGWVVEDRLLGNAPTRNGSGTVAAAGWRGDCTTNASVGYQVALNGGGAWAGGSIHSTCNGSRTNADWSVFSSPPYYNATHDTVTFDPKGIFDTQVWIVEVVFSLSGGSIGSAPPASADYFIGWSSQLAGTTPWSAGTNSVAGIRFKQSSGDTAWLAYTGDGTTQTTAALTSTPVMTSDTRHRLRLELHRANSPYGNCMRVWLDGVLTTKTSNFPVVNTLGVDLYFQVGVWSTGTVATVAEITTSQIRINGYNGDAGPLTAGPTTSDL